jgi:hypothetical protein
MSGDRGGVLGCFWEEDGCDPSFDLGTGPPGIASL